MVLDQLSHAQEYFNLSSGIRAALEFLQRTDTAALPAGRHAVKGDMVVAIVDDYETKPAPERFWEAHRRHIDVQFVASGREAIGVGALERFETEPYDAERDLIVARGAGQFVDVPAGWFAILFPHDVHMPGVIAGTAERVRKVVVKVRLD
jgi:YhcH/YjgK/YiaL family protein